MTNQAVPKHTWSYRVFVVLLALLSIVLAYGIREDWPFLAGGGLGWAVALIILVAAILFALEPMVLSSWDRIYGRFFESKKLENNKSASNDAKYDARLQRLRDELRTTIGLRWRYKMRWLMLTGDEALVEEVAPGLKQQAVLRVGDIVLVHAAPEEVDGQTWRDQLRRLRPARPIDVLIPVVRLEKQAAFDDDVPRELSNLARDLGWAAPITFLHAVSATGNRPESFQAIGSLSAAPLRLNAEFSAGTLAQRLGQLEYVTADTGTALCSGPERINYIAEVSSYIGAQREQRPKGLVQRIDNGLARISRLRADEVLCLAHQCVGQRLRRTARLRLILD